MKSAIVAGADGFLGSALVQKLLENDVEVFALMRQPSKISFNGKKLSILKFDLNNVRDLNEKLPQNVDVYFNMAWVGVSSTVKNDYNMQIKNIDYALATMKLINNIRCKRILFPGSTSEYAYTTMPITENSVPAPSDAYSASKLAVRYFCSLYGLQHNITVIWAPISSIYGPKRKDNNLITYTITSLLEHKTPQFTGLEQQWDYIYISDLITALFLLANQSDVKSGVYPIGSGAHKQLKEYVEIIKDIIDKNANVQIGALPYKTGRIDNCIVDITALTKATGFKPQVSFNDGIMQTINYFKGIKEYKHV